MAHSSIRATICSTVSPSNLTSPKTLERSGSFGSFMDGGYATESINLYSLAIAGILSAFVGVAQITHAQGSPPTYIYQPAGGKDFLRIYLRLTSIRGLALRR